MQLLVWVCYGFMVMKYNVVAKKKLRGRVWEKVWGVVFR